jgi:hypothetical protein
VRWLALPLMPFALAFWLGVLIYWTRLIGKRSSWIWKNGSHVIQGPQRATYLLLSGVAIVLCGGFIFTSFGVDPSGRYFVPLVVPMALMGADFVQARTSCIKLQFGLLLVPLLFNLWGTVQCAMQYPPGLTTQFDSQTVVDHRYDEALIQFLLEEGETTGYTNYWIAYPIVFLSDEELIYVPRLPYHPDLRYTQRDDRYTPYGIKVDNSSTAAYITSRTSILDEYLRDSFAEIGVTWQEKTFGDYRVFYDLSRLIRVEQIGLGKNYP